MPVAELPESKPGALGDVSIVLPLMMGALSSAWAPGIPAVAVPRLSVTFWPPTDTAAALRANEMGAQVILKATKVDGIYDKDPKKFTDAVRYETVSYGEAIAKRLKVMDAAAFALCQDNKMPIIVFDLFKPHNIKRVVMGEKVGTLVTN